MGEIGFVVYGCDVGLGRWWVLGGGWARRGMVRALSYLKTPYMR